MVWPDVDPGQLVLYSIYVYVPIFLVLVIIYSLLRSKYPNLYNPKEQRGYAGILSWIPMAYKWSEKDILDKVMLVYLHLVLPLFARVAKMPPVFVC